MDSVYRRKKTPIDSIAPMAWSSVTMAGSILQSVIADATCNARRGTGSCFKLAEFSGLPEVIRSVEHQLCLFPALYKDELLELARAKVMIPTGITRHLIPGRALGLNLSLDFLTALPTGEAKQAHFQAYLDRLEIEGRIRFYEESVFIMNE